MHVTLILLAIAGHVALWVAVINRLHATSVTGRLRKLMTLAGFACLLSVPLASAAIFLHSGPRAFQFPGASPLAALGYAALCWLALALAAAGWVRRRLLGRPPHVLRYHRARVFRPRPGNGTGKGTGKGDGHLLCEAPGTGRRLVGRAPTEGWSRQKATAPFSPAPQDRHHFLAHLPGNQILDLDLSEQALELPRLPAALDGLSLVHLADLHFTGRIAKSYFLEVVRLANELRPDLACVTGDLIDNPDCAGWLAEILGGLEARFGVYFVLGNHDLEIGGAMIRRRLTAAGLVDLGSRWIEVPVRGQRLVLAGNELPWFPPAADLSRAPPPAPDGPPRIVLAHSPDQIAWAQAADVDLMLAGHTHGGQIRLPLLGPVFAPSRWGVRYASGLFYAAPTTMHVSRGLSAEFPVRLLCPPELAHLVLRSPVAK
jgi:predicted MPP superfamily phosphohydrolase